MRRAPFIISGVPADSFTMEEAVRYAFHLMERHCRDGRSRYACTLNEDSLAGTLKLSLDAKRSSVLLNVFRQADMVMTDGDSIIRASRLLGPALKECSAGADLVHRIILEASARGKSIFLLGDGDARDTAARIKERYPDVTAAGWDAPAGSTGWRKTQAWVADSGVAERINASGADILIVAMGSLKEGLWLHENRRLIRAPLAIGIGRAFDAGGGPCDPGNFRTRPCRPSVASILKMVALMGPSIFLHQYARAVTPHGYLKMCRSEIVTKHGRRAGSDFIALTLPGSVDSDSARRISALVSSRPSARLIVDFRTVEFIDSAGLGMLLDLILRWDASEYPISFTGLNSGVRKHLRVNRMYDLISSREYADVEEALASR
ncbi:MAG: WecB/TagA/CpsF family glycosyltransferase [Desulfomonilia bacterium]